MPAPVPTSLHGPRRPKKTFVNGSVCVLPVAVETACDFAGRYGWLRTIYWSLQSARSATAQH